MGPTTTYNDQLSKPLISFSTNNPTKIERIWAIIKECVIKEFGSCLRHVGYRAIFLIKPHIYNLNTELSSPPLTVTKVDHTVNVILLLHGAGSHPSAFIPLAKKLYLNGLKNVYTVNLAQTDDDQVPINSLSQRVNEITKECLNKGYTNAQFTIIGHSLGALVGTKYIWRGEAIKNAQISMMISLAGRLKYIPNPFHWFCNDVKPEIEETFAAVEQRPNLVPLYTFWGDQDGIVPKESAHIQNNTAYEFTVKGWGHAGIIYAPETHEKIAEIIKWRIFNQ